MRILDLFCGGGGAAMGIHQAIPDAEIVGVDKFPQPEYPFIFVQADILEVTADFLRGFDFVWASPPCQAHSLGGKRWDKEYPCYIDHTRRLLLASGLPYCMENVPGSPLKRSVWLCGTMVGLDELIRHREFEASFHITQPPHRRHIGSPRTGEYVTVAGHGGDGSNRLADWKRAMGLQHVKDKGKLAQAVPPAYSKYIVSEWLRGGTGQMVFF